MGIDMVFPGIEGSVKDAVDEKVMAVFRFLIAKPGRYIWYSHISLTDHHADLPRSR